MTSPALPIPGDHGAGFRRALNVKSIILLALWAAFVLWTGYGAVTNLSAALFPPHFSNPYITNLNTAAPLFAPNLWG